ncbi:hypothetical protein [Vibrio phage vB_pir03]|nr:hypothetical protein [Vibrio phage vB_pir03]
MNKSEILKNLPGIIILIVLISLGTLFMEKRFDNEDAREDFFLERWEIYSSVKIDKQVEIIRNLETGNCYINGHRNTPMVDCRDFPEFKND